MRLLSIFLLLFAFISKAQTTYTYSGIGKWTDEGNWNPEYPGKVVDEKDIIVIPDGSEVKPLSVTVNGRIILKGTIENETSFTSNDTIEISDNGKLYNRSTMTNNGVILNNANINNSFTFNNYGTIENTGNLNNYSTFTNYNTLINKGKITSSSSIFNNGFFDNSGSYENRLRLSGTNTSHTNNFENSGILAPGVTFNGVGTYVFDNNLTLTSSSRLLIDLLNESEADLVQVGDTLSLSGKLTIQLLEDYIPEVPASFVILSADKIIGSFNTIESPELESDKTFNIVYTETSVILEVKSTNLNSVDIPLLSKSKVVVYPTLFDSDLSLELTDYSGAITVQFINSLGEISQQQSFSNTSKSKRLDISSLTSGVYLLNISTGNESIVRRVIKK